MRSSDLAGLTPSITCAYSCDMYPAGLFTAVLISSKTISPFLCSDYADEPQIELLFKKFFPPSSNLEVLSPEEQQELDRLARRFVDNLRQHNTSNRRFTPAELQGYFMQFKDNPVAASDKDNVSLLFDTEYMQRRFTNGSHSL